MPDIPKGAKTPLDRLEAEAGPQDEVGIPLGDAHIRVLPRGQWKKKALTALLRGDLDRWAAGAVHPDDVAKFVDADVTLDEVNAFMEAWGETVGEDVGERGASQRS